MSTTLMTTKEIAQSLVDLCREGKNHDAMKQLYADDVTSVEASAGSPEMSREAHGLDAVMAKGKWWMDNHEVHSAQVTGPWPNDDQFVVNFKYDVTNKPSGKRFIMEEAALYTVREGKIAHETFFYSM